MLAPSPFIDQDLVNFAHLNSVKEFTWDFPIDFDPTSISDFKSAYTSTLDFLLAKNASTATFTTYISELERFLQWSLRVKDRHPFRLNESDLHEYFEFCRKPYSNWVGTSRQRKFISVEGKRVANYKWRPYVSMDGKPASQVSIKKSFATISSYYAYLGKTGVIKGSPFQVMESKQYNPRTKQVNTVTRVFSVRETKLLESTLDKLVESDEKYTRERFIIVAMLHMYLRVSDLAPYKDEIPQMCDFFYRRDINWSFVAYGKGNKERTIPANSAVMAALVSYRIHLNLDDYPGCMEDNPLIQTRGANGPIKSTRQLYNIVKDVIAVAKATAVKEKWKSWEMGALDKASAHWLRHTGITKGVKTRDLQHVRSDAGHASLGTTSQYSHSDELERHLSSELQVD